MKDPSPEGRSPYDEIHELVTASLLGQASPEDMARLETIVRESADARDIYLAYIAETDVLRTWSNHVADEVLEGEIDSGAILGLLDEVEAASERDAVKKAAERTRKELEDATRRRYLNELQRRRADRRPEPIVIPWSVVYATIGSAAAAVVLLVYWFWPQQEDRRAVQLEPTPIQVASIIGSVDAQWSDPGLSSSPGTRLLQGRIELIRGLVEVQLDDGAKTVIESPATLQLLSAKSVQLIQGRLVGNIPRAAAGFTVETPLATFVDLGTEFGVAVDEQEAANVRVFVGEIEAVVRDSGRRVPLTQDRSVRVALVDDQTRIADVPVDQNRYVRQLPDVPPYVAAVRQAKPVIYWRFEASSTGFVRNEMSDSYRGRIQVGSAGATGLGNGVVVFDPSNLGLLVVCDDPRDVPIPENYSIELWMKPDQEHHGTMISLGVPTGNRDKPSNCGVLVGVCGPSGLPNDLDDPVNRLGHLRFLHRSPPTHDVQLGTSCYSEQPYAIQTWQHITAVKDGSAMRLYVNGQLSGRADDPSVLPSGLHMRVGQLYSGSPVVRSFVGGIDELAVYDRALSEEEIRKHYEIDRPVTYSGDTNQR